MARVYVYERPVCAVSTNASFYEKLNHATTGLHIKQEPFDTDDNYQDNNFPLLDTNTNAVKLETIVQETQQLDNINNKENELVLSEDRADTDLSGMNVIVTRKRKRLAFENLKLSEEKAYVRPKSPEPIKTAIECGVCFLKFKSLEALRIHTDCHPEVAMPFCNKCHMVCRSPHLLDDHKRVRKGKQRSRRSAGVSFYCCFCKVQYTNKSGLDSPFFHNHNGLLPCSVEKYDNHCETDKPGKNKKVDETDKTSVTAKTSQLPLTENTGANVISPSVRQQENNETHYLTRRIKQTTTTGFTRTIEDASLEEVDTPKETPKRVVPREMETILVASDLQGEVRRKIVTRRSGAATGQVDLYLKTQKKITRQNETVIKSLSTPTNKKTLIITESSTLNGNTVEENMMKILVNKSIKTEVEAEPSDFTLQNYNLQRVTRNSLKRRNSNNGPFVKTEIDCNIMTKLNKNIKVEIEDEPDYFALQNFSARRITRSSLQRLSNDLNTTPVINPLKRRSPRRLSASTPKEKPKHQSTEEELRVKFKCKDCKINLVRCDVVVKIEFTDVTHLSVEGDERIAEMWRKKMNLKRENSPLVKMNELIKVKVEEPFQCSEVSNAPWDNTEANSCTSFRCKVCKKCFSLQKNLRKHFELRHVFFKSSICDAKYKTKVELQRHYMNEHSALKHMQCCVCLKKFSSLVMLKQHLVLHCAQVLLPERKKQRNKKVIKCRTPYKKSLCKACGKRFWLECCLKEHQKVCTKMREKEKQSQNVSNPVNTLPMKRTLKDANIKLNAPRSKLGLIKKHSYEAESPSMKQPRMSKDIAFGIDKNKFSCTICSKHCKTFRNLRMHERIYSKTAAYVCNICNTAFSTPILLRYHYQSTHTIGTLTRYKYFCTFCAQGFQKKVSVENHTAHFHAGHTPIIPRPWLDCAEDWEVSTACSVCNMEFNSSERFIQHNMFYYKGQMFTCMFCSKTFYGMYMLHRHIKFEHNVEDARKQYTFTCDICNEGFILESEHHAHKLHVHLRSYVETPQNLQDKSYVSAVLNAESMNIPILKYNCDICHMMFVAEEDLRQHMMEYTNDGNYLCLFCTRKCFTDVVLSKHVSLSHTCSNFTDCYKCHYCDEVLTSSTELKSHEVHFHSKISGSQYDSSDQIIANQTTEASENIAKAFSCTICNMKFESLKKLTYHTTEYSTVGLYSCQICNRHFPKLHHLEVHKLRHTNLNFILCKYHCPVCREGFANQINVRMHVMHFHTSTSVERLLASDARRMQQFDQKALKHKPDSNSQPKKNLLKCPNCMKTFLSAKAMYHHKIRYLDEGRHVCEQCGRKFRIARLLREHLKKHARGFDRLQHSCPFCDDTFRNSMARHQHIVHLHCSNI